MDTKIQGNTAGWERIATRPNHHPPAADNRKDDESPCRECGRFTKAVVMWDGRGEPLCPPCGRKIREVA